MANQAEPIAHARLTKNYWLHRFPGLGYSRSVMAIMLSELRAGLPADVPVVERMVRMAALEELINGTQVTKPRKK
ncbi:MAG: hypothetical protein JWP57_726 [Spirosoma sp.]|nr:hypothetical protein [Spirosoma sp.]